MTTCARDVRRDARIRDARDALHDECAQPSARDPDGRARRWRAWRGTRDRARRRRWGWIDGGISFEARRLARGVERAVGGRGGGARGVNGAALESARAG